MSYAKLLQDPRWQKKRLKILERDEWRCRTCNDSSSTLHVHHSHYTATAEGPWDYPDGALVTLCERCHSAVHDHGGWARALPSATTFVGLSRSISGPFEIWNDDIEARSFERINVDAVVDFARAVETIDLDGAARVLARHVLPWAWVRPGVVLMLADPKHRYLLTASLCNRFSSALTDEMADVDKLVFAVAADEVVQ